MPDSEDLVDHITKILYNRILKARLCLNLPPTGSVAGSSIVQTMVLAITTQLLAAASWAGDRIDVIAIGTDSQMYHNSWQAAEWQTDWDVLGGSFASVAPTLVSWSTDRLDALGLEKDDGRLLHNSWNGQTWERQWTPVNDNSFRGPFAASSWAENRLDVFGVGRDEAAMYHTSVSLLHATQTSQFLISIKYNGVAWQDTWDDFSGIFTSNLASTSGSPDRLDIVGIGLNGAMHHLQYESATGWQEEWGSLGGVFTSDPAVSSWAPDRLDVFGLGVDYAVAHQSRDGGRWLDEWESLGGQFTSAPTVVSWGPGRLDVFGLGNDFDLWHCAYENGWTEWEHLGGGPFATPPVAVSRAEKRLDVFVVAEDKDTVYHLSWDGSWSNWQSLGEPVSRSSSSSPSSSEGNRNSSTSSTATASESSNPAGVVESTGGLSTGAKAGIGVGVAIGALATICAVWFFGRGKRLFGRKKTEPQSDAEMKSKPEDLHSQYAEMDGQHRQLISELGSDTR